MKETLTHLPVTPTLDAETHGEQSSQVILRSTPENRCGPRALLAFNLTTLHRPVSSVNNTFEIKDDLVHDKTTDLTWQRRGSEYPLTWPQACEYVDKLNADQYGGLNKWRLPTVDELLSLLPDSSRNEKRIVAPEKRWMWSCDLHGKNESWFINLDMGYAAKQDRDCPNFVVAVCSNTRQEL